MKNKSIIWIAAFSLLLAAACTNLDKNSSEIKKHGPHKLDLSKVSNILTPEALWLMGRVSDVQVSPDGKNILFGIQYYNLDSNKGDRDLYIINLADGKQNQLTDWDGSEFNAIWRPDGKRIAFISSTSGEPQMWEINIDGSNPRKITSIEGGISGFNYSPDQHKIAFIKDVKIDSTVNDIYADLPKANAHLATDLMYRHWDSWHDYAYSHVFYANYNDGKVEEAIDIMKGEAFDAPIMPDGGMEQIAWSANSEKIIYTSKKLTGREYAVSTNSSLYEYDLKSNNTSNLLDSNFAGYDMAPAMSPDGKWMAWESMKTDGFESDKRRLMLRNLETKADIDLSANFDQSSEHLCWDESSKFIYFISGINATFQLYKVNIETKEITQITKGQHDYNGFSIAKNVLIGSRMSQEVPTEIFKIAENGNQEQISFVNKEILEKITPAKSVERWVKTTDGKQMLVWVIYPPNFDSTKTYPALLYCQGGPQSAVSQFYSYRWNFQMMASNGYIVVAPNRRGLPTFGQEWNDQISLDYGGQNMKDYLSAIDDVAKEKYVNKDKLGAIGASYGGFSVYWLAGNHNKRFKAFVSHCGIFNFESMYAATEETFFVNHDLGGAYWQKNKPKSYDFSPHNFVGNWDTPIMVITGENDFRIPYTESMQAFNAAQLKGIPSTFLCFPEESHFVLKPQNSVLWQREVKKFLDTYLK